MLKIIEIGKFRCDLCKDKKKQNGVEIESFGYGVKAKVTDADPEKPAGTGPRKQTITGERFVWREQLHLCLNHLKQYIGEMIDDKVLQLRWQVHKDAAMKKGFVNITYEEAQRRGFI